MNLHELHQVDEKLNIPTVFLALLVYQVHLVKYVWAQPRMFISNDSAAEKGHDIQITCELGLNPPWNSNVAIYMQNRSVSVGQCYNYDCLQNYHRYIASTDGHDVYINITNLDRIKDETVWSCRNEDISVEMFLKVFTSPTAAVLTSSFIKSHSLADGSVVLRCKSDRCISENPSFKWYFVLSSGSRQEFGQGMASSKPMFCSDPERFYYSTLGFPKNMTFPGNADISGRFVCGISFPTLKNELMSVPSGNVTFAVEITSVDLYNGDTMARNESIVTVVENVQHRVSCIHGPARPPPLFQLFVGSKMLHESKINAFNFTPNRSQHGSQIYCKAYNLQKPEDAIVSGKPELYINVPVDSATLLDGERRPELCSLINAAENIPKTLSCTIGESRPSPTIVWYVGKKMRQNHTSNIFTFIPEMEDHHKHVYCVANNLPGYEPVVSSKPMLRVIGRPLPPMMFLFSGSLVQNATFYWIAGYDGGYEQSFVLQYRNIKDNNWINHTQSGQIVFADSKSSLTAYTSQVKNLASETFRARLISRNIRGESHPVTVIGSTFRIMSLEPETESAFLQPSTPLVPVATVLGCMILILLGIIVYLLIVLKRSQPKRTAKTEIKLETIQGTVTETPSVEYETLTAMRQVSGSVYDALERSETKMYENTTLGN